MMLDQWAGPAAYETYMGRWSRRLAPRFLQWLEAPPQGHWLDVGCGTGALTEAICATADPASVLGCDPSEEFIAHAREHVRDERAGFAVAAAPGLPVREGGYDSITSLLALNFMAEPEAAVAEMAALAAGKDSLVSACVWDYGEQLQMLDRFWHAAAALDPHARELDEGRRFRLCRADALDTLFRRSGLRRVHCGPLFLRMVFAGFDDYWGALLNGVGPAPAYVASLDGDRREELARRVRDELPGGPHGRITLMARAWAVRGMPR
ncbi:class I SAM-dependent methyltransferase [Citricoccus sp. SGAir0253]|uniref:class I SAM-dependent methyltransferase n=1 Tax=Citricoccus sp. SGAir0253 TaxID=2567881 RepID=UPI0010CD07CD|nr:class I SAM-dependent methyltransferase [Citricoccus sp. SGAir0253]QCU78597.1 class I SAM-dependent methyltransferase [Citricoccus sp. SGAir0253]